MSEEMFNLALEHVKQHPLDTNTKLFRILVLMNAYLPDSYLLISECHKVLGPPDPIFGGPPFEERMEPFISLIERTIDVQEDKCKIKQNQATTLLGKLLDLQISRSENMETLLDSLGGANTERYVAEFIKKLLTKRKTGWNGNKDKFSRLVEHILRNEVLQNALSVCEKASAKFKLRPAFPQLLARLYYIEASNDKMAKQWARKAIDRAPNNSFIADTLGQIFKKSLKRAYYNIERMANLAFKAFEDVMSKAEKEEAPGMEPQGTVPTSGYFNNRGLFGFIQVAKIAFEKLGPKHYVIQMRREAVENKFEFFENYLTFSSPHENSQEPPYVWQDVALCYQLYTNQRASESTSFPGLLECLNQGLLTSRGCRGKLTENWKTPNDLENIHDDLETNLEQNEDVQAAERFILSNIILCTRVPNSPRLTSETKLQNIIRGFLDTKDRFRSPEFFLLVLLLLWPLKQQRVTYMTKAYERSKYAKYLRGRYLVPLFFLGRGSGLRKWVHTSQLQAILEEHVNQELVGEDEDKKKRIRVKNMWVSGEVWQVAKVQELLLPVTVEHLNAVIGQNQGEEETAINVCFGEERIQVPLEVKPKALDTDTERCYLAFNIKGPVVFRVGGPPVPRTNKIGQLKE